MKIERISENQIRCTLTREDLISRHMKISELAYGSTKTRALFKELMEQAAYQCGFEAEDVPLMIEAVPLSSDSLILLVTKVDTPDELDTRFSRFSEGDEYEDDFFEPTQEAKPFNNVSADDILNVFNSFLERAKKDIINNPEEASKSGLPVEITKMFVFDSLDDIIRIAPMITAFFHGKNSLFKNPSTGLYYLVISNHQETPENYNKVCNILAEYGNQDHFAVGTDKYMKEHYNLILEANALASLAQIH